MDIPRERWPDNTIGFIREGYLFISNRCEKFGSDVFETRLLLQKSTCVKGADAARIFYNNEYFRRAGAMPKRAQKTLLGESGVQTLDGQTHQHRKRLFMSIITPQSLESLKKIAVARLEQAIERWEKSDRIVWFDEINRVLCKTVCEWVGMAITEGECERLTSQMLAMIEAPAAVGPKHWRGRAARSKAEATVQKWVRQVRQGELSVEPDSAIAKMSQYEDEQGRPLPVEVVAVEILNLVRPTVAVGRYAAFAALALHDYPEQKEKIQRGGEEYRTFFVQEVRRFYPFFPAVAAIVKKPFDWQGYHFPAGRRVVLDLYGTNHDPATWSKPEAFNPERFREWSGSPYDFVPQGGGSFDQHHRCAGEWITIELMKQLVELLTEKIDYRWPPQDSQVSLKEVPAIPSSHIIFDNVRRRTRPDSSLVTPDQSYEQQPTYEQSQAHEQPQTLEQRDNRRSRHDKTRQH